MEVITRVETVRGKNIICFESGWRVWLSSSHLPDFSLTEGTLVNRAEFEQFILLHQYPFALEKAVSMLASRPCSKMEISRRLSFHHYDPSVIEMVLYKLEKEKIINDDEFAEQWVQSRIKKYGPGRIRSELVLRGINTETIRKLLEVCSEKEQLSRAVSLARKKYLAAKPSLARNKLFHQIFDMLIRKGYSVDISKKALDAVKNEEKTD